MISTRRKPMSRDQLKAQYEGYLRVIGQVATRIEHLASLPSQTAGVANALSIEARCLRDALEGCRLAKRGAA